MYFVGKNFKVNDLLTNSESWLSIIPTAEMELQTENIYQTFSINLSPHQKPLLINELQVQTLNRGSYDSAPGPNRLTYL